MLQGGDAVALHERLVLSLLRRLVLACFAVLVLAAAASPAALGVPTQLPGNPLRIYVDERGQLQAFREGQENGIFFAPDSTTGDAGFFLAFPNASPASLSGDVYGFEGNAGPSGLVGYAPISQAPTTGSGTSGDPLTQVTTYSVPSYLTITQTTTYVNGTQEFDIRWVVDNIHATESVGFKALAAADFFFEGSDVGTGIFTEGPPRFVGGTNSDTGNSGGFVEVLDGSPAWSHYQALAFGGSDDEVWGKVQNAADSSAPTFDDSILGEPSDNAGGVEWDQELSTLAPGQDATFRLRVRNAVPSALQLSPSNAGAPKGVPITITATATDTAGAPYAGRTLRWQITGVNAGGGSATLDANGKAQIVDPGTNAGADTVVAFVDFNGNGTREAAEPQASALATFVDNVAPNCRVSVSGDRPVGGGQGRPLVIRVNCNEEARITVNTSLQAPATRRRSSSAQRRRRRARVIKLKPVRAIARPGRAVPVRIRIPKSVRRRYAGRRLRARITVTARDASGNVKRRSVTRRIKLAKIKKKRRG